MSISLNNYREQIEEVTKIDNNSINIFKILHQETMENKHSIFLSWLLNPLASHGFGAEFAQKFFNVVFKDNGPIPDANKIVKIITEKKIDGDAQKKLKIDKRRIDILIIGEDFTCTIENKYGSGAHGGQCKDYRDYIAGNEIDFNTGLDSVRLFGKFEKFGNNNKFVFLDIDKPKDFVYEHKNKYANYDFISYKDIRGILDELLIGISDTNNKDNNITSFYIKQYKDILDEKYGYKAEDKYREVYDNIGFDMVLKLTQISQSDYDELSNEEQRFIDEAIRYYNIKKEEYDKEILNNIKEISIDPSFIKSDYGHSKKEGGYAYTIPVSTKVMGEVGKYLFDRKVLNEEEYLLYCMDMKQCDASQKKAKKIVENKVNSAICDINKEKGINKSDTFFFQTIDFRAPMDESKDINILVLAGNRPRYSKNLCSIMNSKLLNDIDNMVKESWNCTVRYYLNSGAGSSRLIEFIIKIENEEIANDIFNDAIIGKTMNAHDIFSDVFWNYLCKVDNCIIEDTKITKYLLEEFIYGNREGITASNKYIANILSNNKCSKKYYDWISKEYPCNYMNYDLIYEVLNITEKKEKDDIKNIIEDNYKITSFKKWMEYEIKSNASNYKKIEDIEENLYLMIEDIINKYNESLTQKNNNNNTTKKIVDYKHIMELIDQRKHKELIPGCNIALIYELQENDKENIKKCFYEKSIRGANVFDNKGEWFRKYIFKNIEEIV